MRAVKAVSAEAEGPIGGGSIDGADGAGVDLAALATAEPEFDLLGALSREQIEQEMLMGGWLSMELSIE